MTVLIFLQIILAAVCRMDFRGDPIKDGEAVGRLLVDPVSGDVGDGTK